MKAIIQHLLAAMLVAVSLQVHAQSSLMVDQESATTPISIQNTNVDGLYLSDEPAELFTQSFIPTLSSIDFVALEFEHGTGAATVYVNLYNSTSPFPQPVNLLGSSTPVTLPSGFENNGLFDSGVADFYFLTPIILTPGQTYYIEPMCSSGGDQWSVVDIIFDTYPNGVFFANGNVLQPPSDLWFQEGIVAVPEPSALALIGVVGLCILAACLT